MDKIKELISVIQGLTVGAAMLKILYIIIQSKSEEDTRERNRKIRNIIIVVIIIETVIYLSEMINRYWIVK